MGDPCIWMTGADVQQQSHKYQAPFAFCVGRASRARSSVMPRGGGATELWDRTGPHGGLTKESR